MLTILGSYYSLPITVYTREQAAGTSAPFIPLQNPKYQLHDFSKKSVTFFGESACLTDSLTGRYSVCGRTIGSFLSSRVAQAQICRSHTVGDWYWTHAPRSRTRQTPYWKRHGQGTCDWYFDSSMRHGQVSWREAAVRRWSLARLITE